MVAALAACGRAEGGAKAGEAKAAVSTPYAAVAAGKVDIEGGLVDIAARQPGVVREVLVQEGAEVVKDQVLARLDDQEARLARNRAQADLAAAQAQVPVMQTALDASRRDLRRIQQLKADNFVSPQRVETASDSVRNAENQLTAQQAAAAAARARLAEADYVVERHIVRAPSDGRIVRRYANPGSGASTLQVTPMFQLQPRAPRIVRAELEERSLREVRPGMAVEIVPEADQSRTYQGTVLRIAEVFGARRLQSDDPSKQTDERVVEVVVDAQQAQVLVGQRVLVKFLKGRAATAAAPARAAH
jgi:HlyD family secretion protein